MKRCVSKCSYLTLIRYSYISFIFIMIVINSFLIFAFLLSFVRLPPDCPCPQKSGALVTALKNVTVLGQWE